LRLYATIVEAARSLNVPRLSQSFFAVSSYLSTTTVLFKKGGFTSADIAKLRAHTAEMSFDEVYFPGVAADTIDIANVLDSYRRQMPSRQPAPSSDQSAARLPLPIALLRGAWLSLLTGGWEQFSAAYVFDVRKLTDGSPYFAGYVKTGDL